MLVLSAQYVSNEDDSIGLDILTILGNLSSKSENLEWTLPSADGERAYYLSDPCPGIVKKVCLKAKNDSGKISELVFIEGDSFTVSLSGEELFLKEWYQNANPISAWRKSVFGSYVSTREKLGKLHSVLSLSCGSFGEEFAEQLLSVKYVRPEYRVLEIGGNIGRNSCVISSILNDSSKLTVVECNKSAALVLEQNRDANSFSFNILIGALSKHRLCQKEWLTMKLQGDEAPPPGWSEVPTFGSEKISSSYDAIIADCEGAFVDILSDFPEILSSAKLVIVENDYQSIADYQKMVMILGTAGFALEHSQGGGWGPCRTYFYQVFTRI